EVRRHLHLGHRDDVALEIGIVDDALRQDLGDGVSHDFADAQLALRAAGGGTPLVVLRHVVSQWPRGSRRAASAALLTMRVGFLGRVSKDETGTVRPRRARLMKA